MELKNQITEILKSKFKKIKTIVQVLTVLLIILTVILLYGWILKNDEWDITPLITITGPLPLSVMLLDKKLKKIAAELKSREQAIS